LQLECGIKNQLINTEYLKMKKLALTIAVVLTMGLSVYAQDGGLLNRGVSFDKQDRSLIKGDQDPPLPPGGHGLTGNQPGAPLGSGVAVLLGLGAAYLIGKKRNEE
jgi:hypothetical protein